MDLIEAHPVSFIATDHVAAEITATYPDLQARYAAALDAAQLIEQRIDDPAELVLCQPCCDALGTDLLPRGMAVGGGGGKAVPSDADGGGA